MAPAIPDRWIPYKACGMVIEGTRIVCFKVPLRKNVQNQNKEIKEIWDIHALLKKLPKLGAVIDLTNTKRYYDPRELEAAGVLYKKMLMPGRVLPPEKSVKEFMDSVDDFMENNFYNLLGVHCTHGLNRTGYMVCRYLIDRLGIKPMEAIKKFEKARGYQIERENYIAHLLGKNPPPPDVGKDTIIKPQYSITDKRQFVDQKHRCDDNVHGSDENFSRKSRSKRKHNNVNSSPTRTSGNAKRKKKSSGSDFSSSNASYDYKYDY